MNSSAATTTRMTADSRMLRCLLGSPRPPRAKPPRFGDRQRGSSTRLCSGCPNANRQVANSWPGSCRRGKGLHVTARSDDGRFPSLTQQGPLVRSQYHPPSPYTGGICPLIKMKKIMAGSDAICTMTST